ncbi:60S ribosomal protein L7-2 [Plasmodium brasilianum]|uniref:60s ribosomal protein L7 n=2 Tax=Plasmodium (Plasmodium) TaxID=418103 RepID=A0A1A8W5G5_PLAMA|nr:60S ribosomal protein L7-2, putative [Plasmodium malariae]KAI4837176.1 60S ribosomal protein L7-2 [Plasmodium brasilianum]SBS86924.1 60s ribosomal protein L7 [Plasmodium malariae]SCO93061.1 60S ribosomal protein L7-2, putative [Plasmodium malariae]
MHKKKESKDSKKNKTGNNNKKKLVKFRRIKKVKFKDEHRVLLQNNTGDEDVKIVKKKKLNTFYKKKEYAKKLENQKKEFHRLRKQVKSQNFDEQGQCIFAIRNKVECIYAAPNQILQELRLNKKFNGVLLLNNKQNMQNLFLVKSYVCYGYIKKYNFYNLMEKRLFLKDGDEIKRCDSNKTIEKLFRKEGIYSFPSFCEYIFECKENVDIILKNHVIPFDFSFLNSEITFDFLQFKSEFAGFMKDEINEILEKII